MKKVLVITARELQMRLRKPAFWIITLLVPLAVALLYMVPVEAAKRAERPVTVLVVDETGLFGAALRSTDLVHFQSMPSVDYAESHRSEGDLLLVIPRRETVMPRDATLYYRGTRPPSLAVQGTVDSQLQQLLRNAILEDVYGLSPSERHSVESSHLHLRIRDAVSGREGMARARIAVAVVLSVLLALAIMLFAMQTMRAVQEERQNRIAEVIATSVRPLQLMAGKMCGVLLAALVQLLVWALCAVAAVALMRSSTAATAIGAVPDMPLLIATFVVAFLLGFMLYAGLLAALAVRLDHEADALQWTLAVCWPLALVPLMVPLIARGSTLLLFIPFTAPAAMVATVPFGVSVTHALLSLVLLAVAAATALVLAARTYHRRTTNVEF